MLVRSSVFFLGALAGALAWAQAPSPGSPVYAFDELLKAASAAGIQDRDITRAIFEGRLHPSLDDLRLAEMNVGGARRWSARFGSISGVGTVKTIAGGQTVSRTGKDLLLRIYMEQAIFKSYFGLSPDPSMTYQKLIAQVRSSKPELVKLVDFILPQIDEMSGVAGYYGGDRRAGAAGFRDDYEALGSLVPPAPVLVSSVIPPPAKLQTQSSPATVKTTASKPAAAKTAAGNVSNQAKLCDDLAAHPDDKGKLGAGVIDEKINSALAIELCSIAAEQDPKAGRLQFQLGRAYWAAEKYDEALEAFLKAEELEYAPAYFYIGMAHEDGLIEGQQPDLAMARDMYMIAASEGFEPAIRAYQDFEEVWNVNFASLTSPNIAQMIYENRFSEIPERASKIQTMKMTEKEFQEQLMYYMLGVDRYLKLNPNQFDAACPAILDAEASAAINRWGRSAIGLPATPSGNVMKDNMELLRSITKQANNPQEAFRRTALYEAAQIVIQAGTDDIDALVADYGGCQGAPLTPTIASCLTISGNAATLGSAGMPATRLPTRFGCVLKFIGLRQAGTASETPSAAGA